MEMLDTPEVFALSLYAYRRLIIREYLKERLGEAVFPEEKLQLVNIPLDTRFCVLEEPACLLIVHDSTVESEFKSSILELSIALVFRSISSHHAESKARHESGNGLECQIQTLMTGCSRKRLNFEWNSRYHWSASLTFPF